MAYSRVRAKARNGIEGRARLKRLRSLLPNPANQRKASARSGEIIERKIHCCHRKSKKNTRIPSYQSIMTPPIYPPMVMEQNLAPDHFGSDIDELCEEVGQRELSFLFPLVQNQYQSSRCAFSSSSSSSSLPFSFSRYRSVRRRKGGEPISKR